MPSYWFHKEILTVVARDLGVKLPDTAFKSVYKPDLEENRLIHYGEPSPFWWYYLFTAVKKYLSGEDWGDALGRAVHYAQDAALKKDYFPGGIIVVDELERIIVNKQRFLRYLYEEPEYPKSELEDALDSALLHFIRSPARPRCNYKVEVNERQPGFSRAWFARSSKPHLIVECAYCNTAFTLTLFFKLIQVYWTRHEEILHRLRSNTPNPKRFAFGLFFALLALPAFFFNFFVFLLFLFLAIMGFLLSLPEKSQWDAYVLGLSEAPFEPENLYWYRSFARIDHGGGRVLECRAFKRIDREGRKLKDTVNCVEFIIEERDSQ